MEHQVHTYVHTYVHTQYLGALGDMTIEHWCHTSQALRASPWVQGSNPWHTGTVAAAVTMGVRYHLCFKLWLLCMQTQGASPQVRLLP